LDLTLIDVRRVDLTLIDVRRVDLTLIDVRRVDLTLIDVRRVDAPVVDGVAESPHPLLNLRVDLRQPAFSAPPPQAKLWRHVTVNHFHPQAVSHLGATPPVRNFRHFRHALSARTSEPSTSQKKTTAAHLRHFGAQAVDVALEPFVVRGFSRPTHELIDACSAACCALTKASSSLGREIWEADSSRFWSIIFLISRVKMPSNSWTVWWGGGSRYLPLGAVFGSEGLRLFDEDIGEGWERLFEDLDLLVKLFDGGLLLLRRLENVFHLLLESALCRIFSLEEEGRTLTDVESLLNCVMRGGLHGDLTFFSTLVTLSSDSVRRDGGLLQQRGPHDMERI
jgi:hypothetical protein